MAFWFITGCLQQEQDGKTVIYFPAAGMPSLSRALSRDHVREWVKQLNEGGTPESVDDETDRMWRIYNGLHADDHVIVQNDETTFSLGEVKEAYRYEKNEQGGKHIWPVRWIAQNIPFSDYSALKPYNGIRLPKEMPAEEARIMFRKYLPSIRTKSYVLFRWVSVGILVAELFYFWPH